jgi:hypothetical protein
MRLRQADAEHLLACRQPWQPVCFDCLGRELAQYVANQTASEHAVAATEVAARDLLDGKTRGHAFALLAAVLARHPQAEKPERAHLEPLFAWELSVPVPIGVFGKEVALSKSADRLPHQPLLVGKRKVHCFSRRVAKRFRNPPICREDRFRLSKRLPALTPACPLGRRFGDALVSILRGRRSNGQRPLRGARPPVRIFQDR